MSEGARCDGSRTPSSEGGPSTRDPTYIITCCQWERFFLSLVVYTIGFCDLRFIVRQVKFDFTNYKIIEIQRTNLRAAKQTKLKNYVNKNTRKRAGNKACQ